MNLIILGAAVYYYYQENQKDTNFTLTDEELELVNVYNKIIKLEHAKGEFSEKEAYKFLKDCLKNEEVIVINNFKMMCPEDLDKAVRDFEKDFLSDEFCIAPISSLNMFLVMF